MTPELFTDLICFNHPLSRFLKYPLAKFFSNFNVFSLRDTPISMKVTKIFIGIFVQLRMHYIQLDSARFLIAMTKQSANFLDFCHL